MLEHRRQVEFPAVGDDLMLLCSYVFAVFPIVLFSPILFGFVLFACCV